MGDNPSQIDVSTDKTPDSQPVEQNVVPDTQEPKAPQNNFTDTTSEAIAERFKSEQADGTVFTGLNTASSAESSAEEEKKEKNRRARASYRALLKNQINDLEREIEELEELIKEDEEELKLKEKELTEEQEREILLKAHLVEELQKEEEIKQDLEEHPEDAVDLQENLNACHAECESTKAQLEEVHVHCDELTGQCEIIRHRRDNHKSLLEQKQEEHKEKVKELKVEELKNETREQTLTSKFDEKRGELFAQTDQTAENTETAEINNMDDPALTRDLAFIDQIQTIKAGLAGQSSIPLAELREMLPGISDSMFAKIENVLTKEMGLNITEPKWGIGKHQHVASVSEDAPTANEHANELSPNDLALPISNAFAQAATETPKVELENELKPLEPRHDTTMTMSA